MTTSHLPAAGASPAARLYGGSVTLEIRDEAAPRGFPRRRYFWAEGHEYLPTVTEILAHLAPPAASEAWAAGVAAGMIEAGAGIFAEREDEDGRTIGSIGVARFADLINDAPRAPRRARRDAAILNARFHDLAALIIRGKPAPLRNAGHRLTGLTEALKSWLKARQPVPLAVSRTVASRRHRFAGTASLVARIGGEIVLVAFKTGRPAGLAERLQTAAYALAFEEETGTRIARHAIVRLNETTGEFNETLSRPSPALTDAFLCLREYHSLAAKAGEAE